MPAAAVGLVLAGGRSQRMGEDKGSLDAGGESLAARAARKLAAVCAEVAVADRGRRLLDAWPSLPDGAGEGPVAGLLAGALAFPGRSILALACDLPEVPAALLAEIGKPSGFDWVVPRRHGRLEPLCALYRPPALAALAAQVERGILAPHRLADAAGLSVRYLDAALLAHFGDPEAIFVNLNRPEDLQRWRERRRAGG